MFISLPVCVNDYHAWTSCCPDLDADAVLLCDRAAELLTKPTTEKLPSDAEGLQASFAKLESVIAQTAAYVDDVVVRCAAKAPVLETQDTVSGP